MQLVKIKIHTKLNISLNICEKQLFMSQVIYASKNII